MPHHDSYYRQNEAYAEHLANWNPALYAKYAGALKPAKPGARVLDVGCGVGRSWRGSRSRASCGGTGGAGKRAPPAKASLRFIHV